MTIQDKIRDAKNLEEMNALRMEVVKARDAAILKQWQDKYWSMKSCPGCGKTLEGYQGGVMKRPQIKSFINKDARSMEGEINEFLSKLSADAIKDIKQSESGTVTRDCYGNYITVSNITITILYEVES